MLQPERGTCQTLGIYPEMGARAVITMGATLSGPSWPADSRIESWVMDTGTPLTKWIGV